MRSLYGVVTVCACVAMLSVTPAGSAPKPEEGQLAMVKKQVQFSKWQKLLNAKPEVRYGAFELGDDMVSPWRIQRTQRVELDGQCSMTSSVLAQADDPKKTKEIIRISITRCPSRGAALERLLNHLLGVQRPDLTLVEKDELTVGDITVQIPGTPEPALLFVRGNILITVEAASEKVSADIRKLAMELDTQVKRKKQ